MASLIKNTIEKWWILLIAGILSLAVGIYAFCNPDGTFEVLSTILMVYLIVSGICKLIAVIKGRRLIPAWGWVLAAAIINIVLAVMVAVLPYGKDLLVAFMAGFAVISEGVDLILTSMALQYNKIKGWGWFLALGIITIVLGVLLLAYPMASMAFVVFLFGFAFEFEGIDLIAFSIALARLNSSIDRKVKEVKTVLTEEAKQIQQAQQAAEAAAAADADAEADAPTEEA